MTLPINSPLILTIFIIFLHTSPAISVLCRDSCNNIPIKYPFGIDDGCGAPQFRGMLNCSADLFFLTPSGSYKIQTIDYSEKTVIIFDPSMSTCSVLQVQPHHDFLMTEIQSVTIPPSPDTVFALMNCSIDSPVLNRYRYLCFNFSGHSCDELYVGCTSFKRSFNLPSNATPSCCFTKYDTLKLMSMNILDCTHYMSVYNVDSLASVVPLDWLYGMKLSYGLPDLGCERCAKSGGTCGFDVDTLGFACICSTTTNATPKRDCGGAINQGKKSYGAPSLLGVVVLVLRAIFYILLLL